MTYNYGEAFNRLGIPGMGHQGATWCELNPDGVLVLMAHQKYVRFKDGPRRYETPSDGPQPPRSASAKRSLAMISAYFAPERAIVLPIAEFVTDGGIRSDGTWESSVFKHATGDAYNARMQSFDPVTGYLLCLLDERFSY
jgi:hypothetical protein